MKKAILKTLIYADIFDYPLKIQEIHKWLIGRKTTLRQIEKTLEKLQKELRIARKGKYFFLRKKKELVARRARREKPSAVYFKRAKILSQLLKIIPWVKLAGISGGLAMENVSYKDDIDLFIITAKNRLWISRLFILGLLSAVGKRRKRQDSGRKIAGKFCVNILLEEDRLVQVNKDLFTAHEVLQMKVLWQRDGVYSKYLSDNSWTAGFFPNWIAISSPESTVMNYESRIRQKNHNSLFMPHNLLVNILENLAKWFQLTIMQQPQGRERIADGALYFHPRDCRKEVLRQYQKRLTRLLTPAS